MRSTMNDGPLSLARLLRYATTAHSAAAVSTWTGDGCRRRTYGEMAPRMAQLANALQSLGIGRSDRVATFMWNNSEHLEVYAAVPAMGAVVHPLNIRLSPSQVGYVANHAEDQVVIVDGSLVSAFEQALTIMTTVRHVVVVGAPAGCFQAPPHVTVHGYEELLAGRSETYCWPDIDERSAAAMCYTSGTTGDPKGVVYSHRSLYLHALHVTTSMGMGLSTRDTCLVIVPMFHVNAWSLPYASMMSGASLLMPDRFLQPEPLLAMLAAERPTVAAAVPAIYTGILQTLARTPQDLTHLQRVFVGGSAAPLSLLQAYEGELGVTMIQGWGMTETSAVSATAALPAGHSGDDPWAYRATQGQLAPLVDYRLKNDAGEVVANDGVSLGELQVRGPWVTAAYYARDGAERDRYAGSFDGDWLRTGDVGRVSPDGYLTLVDRAKDVIKSGGEWISSVDLENDLMAHPDVAEAAVFGIPDQKWDERPCAVVVLKKGVERDPKVLRDHLSGNLPKWQLPDSWVYIEEVPKTSVGKFDKKLLRQQFADGHLEVLSSEYSSG
jgi:fatty-acyl-CoA synthase